MQYTDGAKMPLFTKHCKFVPAMLGMLAAVQQILRFVGQPEPSVLQHRSYLWLPFYSSLDVTYVTYTAIYS